MAITTPGLPHTLDICAVLDFNHCLRVHLLSYVDKHLQVHASINCVHACQHR